MKGQRSVKFCRLSSTKGLHHFHIGSTSPPIIGLFSNAWECRGSVPAEGARIYHLQMDESADWALSWYAESGVVTLQWCEKMINSLAASMYDQELLMVFLAYDWEGSNSCASKALAMMMWAISNNNSGWQISRGDRLSLMYWASAWARKCTGTA